MPDDEYEFDEVSPQGYLARVVAFTDDRSTMYFRQRHGSWQWASSQGEELHGSVGDVIFVAGDSYRVVAKDLWEEDRIIGVVRLNREDVTVLDVGNRLETVPTTTEIDFGLDNTVEATESRSVVRILSEEALPPLDRGAASDGLLARVKQTDFSDADSLDSIGGLAEIVREARRLVLLPIPGLLT